jgi:hypothetical protein
MIKVYDKRDLTHYKFIFQSGLNKGWGGSVGLWYGKDRDIAKWEEVIPDLAWTLKNDEAEVEDVDSSDDRQILIRVLFEYPK